MLSLPLLTRQCQAPWRLLFSEAIVPGTGRSAVRCLEERRRSTLTEREVQRARNPGFASSRTQHCRAEIILEIALQVAENQYPMAVFLARIQFGPRPLHGAHGFLEPARQSEFEIAPIERQTISPDDLCAAFISIPPIVPWRRRFADSRERFLYACYATPSCWDRHGAQPGRLQSCAWERTHAIMKGEGPQTATAVQH